MRLRIVVAVAVLSAVTVPAASTASTSRPASGRFLVTYAKARNADERLVLYLIKSSELTNVMNELSKALVIPKTVTISVRGGQAGPYYSSATHVIVYNFPFAELGLKVFKAEYPKISDYNLGVAFASLEYFVLFHEIGHALVDEWNVPVLGREEDAVDAFSTIFMTEFVPNGGQIALWGADFFDYLGRHEGSLGQNDFADEHSLDPQRAYSIACWVYGSNPAKYRGLEQVIPQSRLVRCPAEYKQLRSSWLRFLKPHVRAG